MQHEESGTESRMNAAWIALLIVGVFVASLMVPAHNGISERSPRTTAVYDVKTLLLGCRAYAADHGGDYPPSLEILYPDYIDMEKIFCAIDEGGRRLSTRIPYYTGHTDTGDPKAILLEHPVVFKGTRIVGYVGGHVMEVPVN